MKQIAHELEVEQTSAFVHMFADNYPEYDFRPALCRVACIEFEGVRYLAATDGMMALFFKFRGPQLLPLGDYEGLPYMVKCEDDTLCRILKGLLAQLVEFSTTTLYVDDNVVERRCFITEEPKTDVLLAHIEDDGRFVISLEIRHSHIFNRERYEFLCGNIGFDAVRYSEPNKMLMFSGYRGFALLMPIHADAPVEIVTGG